jgi:serine/threonine protein phosphatase PrpC
MREVSRIVEDGGSGQDRAGVFMHDDLTVIVIADGAGGTSGGDLAADRVVAAVEQTLRSGRPLVDSQTWVECIARVDADLNDVGQTTALIVVLSDTAVVGASVGDSEAKLFTSTRVIELTEGQSRKPLVGSGLATPRAFQAPMEQGVLLVASDGLWKYAPPAALVAAVRSPDVEQIAFAAVESARLGSGLLQDDLALVTVLV